MTQAEEVVWFEDFAHTERDQILTRVRLGEVQPGEAEELARSKGLEPFATQPDHRDHDPLKKPYWSLTMALAWVATRDPQRVAYWDKDFRDRCWEWFPILADAISPAGHELRPLPPADLRRFEEFEATTIGQYAASLSRETIRESREALWSALMEGKITAEATPEKQGQAVPIPASDWQTMTADRADASGLERLVWRRGSNREAYLDPLIARDAILAIWRNEAVGAVGGQSTRKGPIIDAAPDTVLKYARDYYEEHGVPPTQGMGRTFARANRYSVKAFEREMRKLPEYLRIRPGTKQAFANRTSAEN
jgi:hypothetical protein